MPNTWNFKGIFHVQFKFGSIYNMWYNADYHKNRFGLVFGSSQAFTVEVNGVKLLTFKYCIATSLLKNKKQTIETITEFVMVLLVIMGLVLVLMETVMVLVGFWLLAPSISGLLKSINPN